MMYLVQPGIISSQLKDMVKAATGDLSYCLIENHHELPDLKNKKVLFAVEVDAAGVNIPLFEILSSLATREAYPLEGSTAAILVHSNGQLYTKSIAAHLVFVANQLGCSFIGQPLVEATDDLSNFLTWKKIINLPLREISLQISQQLGSRLRNENREIIENPKIVVLHSSSRTTSNTLTLWRMVSTHLHGFQIDELPIENGSVYDCYGCSFKTCLSFGQKNSCYYGGVMTKTILPAIEEADGVVWICPNYNDAISSNLMAVINRLTALYRKISFNNKTIFSIIVSGNSGSDSVAKQLIDALNINKGFYLPPRFAMMETANDPGAIMEVANIESKAQAFAEHMIREMGKS
ncbi:flavodoxin family protein [Alkaliphilus peptidifermentans]|uniref:Multimeric flavodoxin WrbA n=1 Tax=Alkaliphilus peptidifermentans DSM 18978 TaxID=1120976 RepID=A0A1G5GK16_9FIRM|nr:NAD(P)H-dependent oxidoreductase [Alkaliphilus peptidifermentans]SCY51550.1 Multimeric flavodoxin WrbA [Alkaliphilus peptidifermentans DSM 18978]